ncbi:peptide chain release factor 2 [Peptostreptococcus russellii]|uniref:peptide chain release factor 2 n=1 Tax=Peptostreptococcus russellii TaxID=215200 RepID=UPI0011812386|nr:peptide chain release factor 2 [Peptostreptococcus russellii]MBC2577866.1 peptide chain release factor 2 [Peptostreptococcus russellii]
MINIQDYKSECEELSSKVRELGFHFDLDSLKARQADINTMMEEQSFWENSENANKILQENKHLTAIIEEYGELNSELEDIETLIELGQGELSHEEDEEVESSIKESISKLSSKIESMTLEMLFSGEYDSNNAIVSINSGTGGLDAQDWSQMLLRMYIRWAEDRGMKVRLLDLISDPAAGIKTATILVQGRNAYGYLKSEKGVHRLVRISPFDSSGKRHTSFASVDVTPELDDDIDIELNPNDLKIDTYRASGAGGQHVNTTDSAVRITHLPTGIVVSCQNERSQHTNKDVAMKLLIAKLIQIKEEEKKEKIEDIHGQYNQITWGSQIRSYVFQPYKLVKDHRTNIENANVDAVMDGELDSFMYGYLRAFVKKEK